jgi:hypothetical protein
MMARQPVASAFCGWKEVKNSPTDSPATAPHQSMASALVEPPLKRRARRTNDPFAGVSANTARGRRVIDLARGYLQRLGDRAIEPFWQAAAVQCAELQELAEHARAESRRAGSIDPELVRIERLAALALKRLDLAHQRAESAVPSDGVDGYLAALKRHQAL